MLYHLIIVPKYRHKIFNYVDIRETMINIIETIKHKYFSIIDYSVETDHIHFCLDIKPNIKICDVVKYIKQISAFHIFYKYIKLKKTYFRKSKFWSRGYYISSIGNISSKTVLKYIKSQELYNA